MKWFLRILVIGGHLIVVLLVLDVVLTSPDSGDSGESSEASAPERRDKVQTDPETASSKAEEKDKKPDQKSDGAALKKLRRALLANRKSATLPRELKAKAEECTAGAVFDISGSEIRWQKNLKRVVPIASLTKMMTTLVLVDYVHSRDSLSLNSTINVSAEAADIGGSQIYMEQGESFTVREVIEAMMIFSACDAAYAAAEFVGGGNEARGVARMNKRAKKLGLDSLQFSNPHGLPVYEQDETRNKGSVLDVSLLAAKLLQHPEVVDAASTWMTYIREDTGDPFQMVNRNELVKDIPGVNGMKTGYTDRAGFCVVLTYQKNGESFIVTATGCESKDSRNALVTDLLHWALNNSGKSRGDQNSYVVKKGDTLYEIAQKHDVSVSAIKKANNLQTNLIKEGQELVIPTGGTSP